MKKPSNKVEPTGYDKLESDESGVEGRPILPSGQRDEIEMAEIRGRNNARAD